MGVHEIMLRDCTEAILNEDGTIMTLTISRKTMKFQAESECLEEWLEEIQQFISEKNDYNYVKDSFQEEDTDRFAFQDGFFRNTLYHTMLFKQRKLIHNEYIKIYEEHVKTYPED